MASLKDLVDSGAFFLEDRRRSKPAPDFSQPDLRKALIEVLPLKLKAMGMPCDADHVASLSFHTRIDIDDNKRVHVRCKGKTIVDEDEVDSLVRHLVDKKQWDRGAKKRTALSPPEDADPFEGEYADNRTQPRFDGDYARLASEFAERVFRACKLFYGGDYHDFSAFTIVRHIPSLDIEVFLGPVTKRKDTGENRPVLSVEEVRIFCNNYGVDMPCLFSAMCEYMDAQFKDDRSAVHGPVPSGEVVVALKKPKRRLG